MLETYRVKSFIYTSKILNLKYKGFIQSVENK